jgi:ribosomal protein L37E
MDGLSRSTSQGSPLQGKDELKCSCGKGWDGKAYRRSISTRVLLPCPHCNTVIRKPTFTAADQDAAASKEADANQEFAAGQENENHLAARQVQCPKCPATALHVGGFIECAGCGFKRRWRDYRRSLKRKDEKLTCPKCEHTFEWQAWRKDAGPLVTGNPQPARDFVAQWPTCRTPQARMMKIDFLLQTLHGRGPLAPWFIEGDETSIRRLLDELAEK